MRIATWTIVAAGGAMGLALITALVLGYYPFQEFMCGTSPEEHRTVSSPWIVATEQYSCGLGSGWTDVRALNKETGARIKLFSFDEIEEFSVQGTDHTIELIASDLANVQCFNSTVDGLTVTYRFDADVARYKGAPMPRETACLMGSDRQRI